jgi:methylase of polypeptide subunit release factors
MSLALNVYRSRPLARFIFGIDFLRSGPEDYYFDISTVVLFKRLCKVAKSSDHVLDLGTGAHAVIGLSVWKRIGCRVTCCDINAELVLLARKSIQKNNAPIEVVQSNFFANISTPFTIVTFNPPYIPSEIGKGTHARRSQWDGGDDGTRIIPPFLDALETREHDVTAYLAMNRLFVSREKMLSILRMHPKLSLRETVRSAILPITIYVIDNRLPK